MAHAIHRVTQAEQVGDFTLALTFEDGSRQTIDFRPVLTGEVFGPLADPRVFRQFRVDPEAHTIVWPNGADFDPATLHDWSTLGPEFERLASGWAKRPSAVR
ncbi:MAG TPA: DUF2442 domain-containing protein [Thermoanaerobaculia bacterium]|nr:DUF2442 domain-containing protein [Thermoanaerobaculia bacterium]